jgi:CrcB protein
VESYAWIALGSALGGMGRYWCAGVVARRLGEAFPWGTLVVNVSGAFVIGFVDALVAPGGPTVVNAQARLFIMAGLCGGYTTFSAFSLQTLDLAREGHWLRAGGNVGASVVACLASVWLGRAAAVALGRSMGG